MFAVRSNGVVFPIMAVRCTGGCTAMNNRASHLFPAFSAGDFAERVRNWQSGVRMI
jgi:hypothetical protein